MKINENFDSFIKNFNIVDNALGMRTLVRWNGRDLIQKENLAEHTHLVVACVLHLANMLATDYRMLISSSDLLMAIQTAMIHDSLELLRGDILTITKDSIPGLRDAIDKEEKSFFDKVLGPVNGIVSSLVHLADLMACYKFLERELRLPNNDFCKEAYVSTRHKFDVALEQFLLERFGVIVSEADDVERFVKGYKDDAGVDIILDRDVEFLPMSTTCFDLNVSITPAKDEMALLCARTSAAAKGLSVAMCPIDPYFVGNCTAIVHNISNQILRYKKGEAFCQYVMVKMITQNAKTKKEGTRSISKLGGTDN